VWSAWGLALAQGLDRDLEPGPVSGWNPVVLRTTVAWQVMEPLRPALIRLAVARWSARVR
jgi:hypothetical protein